MSARPAEGTPSAAPGLGGDPGLRRREPPAEVVSRSSCSRRSETPSLRAGRPTGSPRSCSSTTAAPTTPPRVMRELDAEVRRSSARSGSAATSASTRPPWPAWPRPVATGSSRWTRTASTTRRTSATCSTWRMARAGAAWSTPRRQRARRTAPCATSPRAAAKRSGQRGQRRRGRLDLPQLPADPRRGRPQRRGVRRLRRLPRRRPRLGGRHGRRTAPVRLRDEGEERTLRLLACARCSRTSGGWCSPAAPAGCGSSASPGVVFALLGLLLAAFLVVRQLVAPAPVARLDLADGACC